METNDKIINGKIHADNLLKKIYPLSVDYIKKYSKKPTLAVVLIGNDPASEVYVRNKITTANKNNIDSLKITFSKEVSENILLDKIIELNNNPDVHGILVQLPLPKHISEKLVIKTINPEKDVDGFHPVNVGRMALGQPAYISATPYGITQMLEQYEIETSGKHCVVIGRSNIVGSPMSILMAKNSKYANCTVTLTHSRTKNLEEFTKAADIVIVALGKPAFLTGEMIKEGAIVIDVGITRVPDDSKKSGFRIQGDADFTSCAEKASYITPVPGGVGLMTVASLLKNTLAAAKKEIYG